LPIDIIYFSLVIIHVILKAIPF